MKKWGIIMVIGMISFAANSQTTKGSQSVGLMFSFQNFERNGQYLESTNKRMNFYPNYEYFVKDNLALVGGFTYVRNSFDRFNEVGHNYRSVSTTWIGYMGLRKYWELKPSLFFSLTNGLAYQWEDQNYYFQPSLQADSYRNRINQLKLFSQLGLVYFPIERFAFELILLDAGLEYNRLRTYQETVNTSKSHWLTGKTDLILNQPTLSIRYYF
jgi:hypothetical protein